MKKYFTLLFLCVLLLGCENKNEKLNGFIASTFPDLKNGEILVIPSSGCTSCITDAENSIDSLVKLKDFKVIFSQIQSLKTLNNRLILKKINSKNPNILIDSANLYIENSKEYNELWGFPTKITVRDHKVIKIARQ